MIRIEYFGLIAEMTNCRSESFDIIGVSILELKDQLAIKYPELKILVYQIAVNLKIVGNECTIQDGDKIAILPPFAGG